MSVRVGWLFSMARSGSSVAAYGAAAPWGHGVADEIFGPWDRTEPPYHYPETQLELAAAFNVAGLRIDDDVKQLATELFEHFGRETGFVICKSPHIHPTPDDVSLAFPDHAQVFLLRNPLHRLNSLHARNWLHACGPRHDLERYKTFARRWKQAEHRVAYDDLRADPHRFFESILRAWGLDASADRVQAAVDYAQGNYHDSSLVMSARKSSKPLSEAKFRLPDEAISAYLEDDFVRELMVEQGWSVDPADYRRKGLFR
jgi:hypothetical protein